MSPQFTSELVTQLPMGWLKSLARYNIQDMTVTTKRQGYAEKGRPAGPVPPKAAADLRVTGATEAELHEALGRLGRTVEAAAKAKK